MRQMLSGLLSSCSAAAARRWCWWECLGPPSWVCVDGWLGLVLCISGTTLCFVSLEWLWLETSFILCAIRWVSRLVGTEGFFFFPLTCLSSSAEFYLHLGPYCWVHMSTYSVCSSLLRNKLKLQEKIVFSNYLRHWICHPCSHFFTDRFRFQCLSSHFFLSY